MHHNQRKSIDPKNRSYIDDEIEQVSLNYTSSIKSNNKEPRPRFYSSNEKPEKRYDYTHDFMLNQHTPSSNQVGSHAYHAETLNINQHVARQNSTGLKNQRRQRQYSREKFEKEMEFFKDKTLEKQDYQVSKNQRRIGKNYYGGLGNHNLSDFPDEYNRKQPVDHNTSTINPINQREVFSFASKERPHKQTFEKNYAKYSEENKQNTMKSNLMKKDTDNQIRSSFQKLNEEQILQKIGRINKLNGEINSRLQKILAKVSMSD